MFLEENWCWSTLQSSEGWPAPGYNNRFKKGAKKRGAGLSIQVKMPGISVGTSDGTNHFGLVRQEYSGPALKVVDFDRSGHLGG